LTFIDVPEKYYVRGLLAIYELNRVELFKDVFIWAYERSAMRYAAVRHSLGEFDAFQIAIPRTNAEHVSEYCFTETK